MRKKYKQLTLFDTWEEDWKWWGGNTWVKSKWNKNTWYYQTTGWYGGMTDNDEWKREKHEKGFEMIRYTHTGEK